MLLFSSFFFFFIFGPFVSRSERFSYRRDLAQNMSKSWIDMTISYEQNILISRSHCKPSWNKIQFFVHMYCRLVLSEPELTLNVKRKTWKPRQNIFVPLVICINMNMFVSKVDSWVPLHSFTEPTVAYN